MNNYSRFNLGIKRDVNLLTLLAKQSSQMAFCEREFDSFIISPIRPSASESLVTFVNARSVFRVPIRWPTQIKTPIKACTYTTLNLQILWKEHHTFNKKHTSARI